MTTPCATAGCRAGVAVAVAVAVAESDHAVSGGYFENRNQFAADLLW